MSEGIYTLANDAVVDSLIALLNSLRANAGERYDVVILPFDNRTEKARRATAGYEGVRWFDDEVTVRQWRERAIEAWDTCPGPRPLWRTKLIDGVDRAGCSHRLCAFDPQSPFERFLYLDADTLVLGSLRRVFRALEQCDLLAYDFQHRHPQHVYNTRSPRLTEIFPSHRLQREIFCSGFFGSKRGALTSDMWQNLLGHLRAGEGEILYPASADQTLLNYAAMRAGMKIINLAHRWPIWRVTGNSVTSSHFRRKGAHLFDRGRRLTYLHYVGLPSGVFREASRGAAVDFRYRDIFLYYRNLRETG